MNGWIIKARWFYMLGIFAIGVLTKVISQSNVNFSFGSMLSILAIFIAINSSFYLILKKARQNPAAFYLNFLSYAQIIIELFAYTIIMHLSGGVESISLVFFFLPVVASSLIFGSRGAILTAFFSGLFTNSLALAEHFGYIEHIFRYGVETLEFQNLSITLTKTVTTSIFYLVVGFFTGYGANILFRREHSLEGKTIELNRQKKNLLHHEKKLKVMNQELLEEKNKISAILANFVDPVIFVDEDNRLSLFNPAAGEVLGLKASDVGAQTGKKDFSLADFKTIKKEIMVEKRENERVGDWPVEEVSLKHGGEDRTYKVVSALVKDKKDVYGKIKIFYDLTREKVVDRLKSEFISIAAHQLRTPLSAIKWVIRIILDGDAGQLNKEQEDLLNKGYKSNERMIELVDDLLNVSRLEEGRFGYNFSYGNLCEVINSVIEDLESLIAKNHLKLVYSCSRRLPKVYLDSQRIRLVLENLLDNAIKYTPEYGRVEMKVEEKEKFLQITVKDSGVGIAAEDQPKLFSKFFRGQNVMRMQTEGTGLGLFIAKKIVEKHYGQINISSEEGKGTEVVFTLPLEKS